MKYKTNLSYFFNEFNLSLRHNLYGMIRFRNFYKASKYNLHLQKVLIKFRYEMYYQLAYEKDLDKEIFLRNLYKELIQKKKKLDFSYYHKKRVFKYRSMHCNVFRNVTNWILFHPVNGRRFRYLYFKQVRLINRAIYIVEQSADAFQVELLVEKKNITNFDGVKWKGGYLEFVQLYNSLVHSGRIVEMIPDKRKALEQAAQLFNFELPKNTESSLSHALHARNMDYSPKIFKDLLDGYKIFEEIKRGEKG